MGDTLYDPGSGLEIPGLEAILEYGDASRVAGDHIPGALRINDHSRLERVRVAQMDGLHDEPDGAETRQPNADRHGESAGLMLYRGRTIGLTGRVEAGNLGAMRDWWRKLRSAFGSDERDLLVRSPLVVPIMVNEVLNPSFEYDAKLWDALSSAGGTVAAPSSVADGIVQVGSAGVAGATGAGYLSMTARISDAANLAPLVDQWAGEDVWVIARVKVHAATGTVSSLQLGAAQWTAVAGVSNTLIDPTQFVSQSSPTTGTWYLLASRFTPSALDRGTQYVSPQVRLNFAGSGSYTLHVDRVALVRLASSDATPSAYFGSDLPGFEPVGDPSTSPSQGPCYAVNLVPDPRLDVTDPDGLLTSWSAAFTTGQSATPVVPTSLWSGDVVPRSAYFKSTHDLNTTSRVMGVVAIDPGGALSQRLTVADGRRYRFTAKVNMLSIPASGTTAATILWYNAAGTLISISTGLAMTATGVQNSDVSTVSSLAPAGAVAATVGVYNPGVTTSGAVFELYLSDPCFVDITDQDPGEFFGLGDVHEEVGRRRRVARPFLLRGVRKVPGDLKAPEQQSRMRAWRDFTMSLRASDPRIYVLEQRHRALQLSGSPQFYSGALATLISAGGAIATPPTGFTAEGQSGTTGWRYGVSDLFSGRSEMSIGDATNAVGSAPAAAAIQRAYRTSVSYTNPRVTVQGHYQMRWPWGGSRGNIPALGWDNVTSFSWNTVGVVIKRVSATQWLELRVNSSNNALANQVWFAPNAVDPPYSVELWSSHNTFGAATTTRLAAWDFASGAPISDPAQYPMTIQAEILTDDTVAITITGSNSSGAFTTLSESYAMNPALASLFGSGVGGQAGEYVRSDNWASSANSGGDRLPIGWSSMVAQVGFPWISYFTAQHGELADSTLEVPVIGSIDTPPSIELRGDLVNPVITLTSTDERGSELVSTLRMTGTAQESNPVTINVDDGAITDAGGANRYSMLQSGRLLALRPGLNYLNIDGEGWGSYPRHVTVYWRDALS